MLFSKDQQVWVKPVASPITYLNLNGQQQTKLLIKWIRKPCEHSSSLGHWNCYCGLLDVEENTVSFFSASHARHPGGLQETRKGTI